MHPRLPLAKAEANGAAKDNPKRHRDRKEPKAGPIGQPPADLTKEEKACWRQFVKEAPWFTEADRTLLAAACQLRAKMFTPGLNATERGQLMRILGQLGCTPTDRSRVHIPSDADRSTYNTIEDYLN